MTLRHRLLLVYGIVVLLSVATVGTAVFETAHARQIIRELQDWNDIVRQVEKLKLAWPPLPGDSQDDFDLRLLLPQFRSLAGAPAYLDTERVREALGSVYRTYDEWKKVPQENRVGRPDEVESALKQLALVVSSELNKLNGEADRQSARTQFLLLTVVVLTVIHVGVIGSLLKRWLLQPLEQLNRQVEALARDMPPPEPLLRTPQELAKLASELDRARESLGALRQQLIDSERLTTIGQLAAQLAHNLRNPLASIRATAQVTARQAAPGQETLRRMQEIVKSVDRMNQWIAGLMEVARREPTPTPSADVVPLLHRIREALAAELAAKDLTLCVEAPASGLICAHDVATLEHALIAMVVNAIEASPLGASIVLAAELLARDGDAQPHLCRISVRDCGCGLPPEAPERIFEFSYSTKQRGMGLGLALARQALQRQGGAAHAHNNPGGGATVYVELPAAADGAGTTSLARAAG